MSRYQYDILPQGMVYIMDLRSLKRGIYSQDGVYYSGDLRLPPHKVYLILSR